MATHPENRLRELSLFSGGGGGLLASQWIKKWRTVCYVEKDPYAVEVLKSRIYEGLLDDAPIWDDAGTFDGVAWRGLIDVVTAGFPCQPFSTAGKQRAEKDDRNGWPAVARIVREVRPPFVFLENVPGLLAGTHQYFGRVLGELAEAGYNAEWIVLGADNVGAPHYRKRVWIKATNTDLRSEYDVSINAKMGAPQKLVSDSDSKGERGLSEREKPKKPSAGKYCEDVTDADSQPIRKQQICKCGCEKTSEPWWSDGWEAQSGLDRVVDGVAGRLDRLRVIGNGQVPGVAALAWELLSEK